MAKTNVKTQTGNRVVIQFDGKQIGLVQSVRANDDYGPEPASGIGDIHAAEYVPTMARHSLSVARNTDKGVVMVDVPDAPPSAGKKRPAPALTVCADEWTRSLVKVGVV